MKSLFLSLLLASVLFMNSFSEAQVGKWKGEGTTRNLETIVMGRCYDYIRLLNPSLGLESDPVVTNMFVAVWKQKMTFHRGHINKSSVMKDLVKGKGPHFIASPWYGKRLYLVLPEKTSSNQRLKYDYPGDFIVCGNCTELEKFQVTEQNNPFDLQTVQTRMRRREEKKNHEKNCSEMWEAFKNAFINKDPCNILPKDYELFINLSLHTIPPNKSLFWENNQLLVNSFSGRGRRYMSLGDTLFGFFADFLNWCGQANSNELDYESCPTTKECENNAVESFWRMASITYAQHSSGVIHVLLNGSAAGGAYPQPGFFADYEIPNLQKDKISQIVIWVVDDIEGPDIDSCGTHTVKILEDRLKTLGYDITCTDNYESVMFLLCLDNPDDSKCTLPSSAPAAQRGPVSSDRGGSWNKLMFVSFVGFLFRFALVY